MLTCHPLRLVRCGREIVALGALDGRHAGIADGSDEAGEGSGVHGFELMLRGGHPRW